MIDDVYARQDGFRWRKGTGGSEIRIYEDLEKVQGSTLANRTILTMAELCRRRNQGSRTPMEVDATAKEYPHEAVKLRNGPYNEVNESNSTGTERQDRP
jgi:hypothetical protein